MDDQWDNLSRYIETKNQLEGLFASIETINKEYAKINESYEKSDEQIIRTTARRTSNTYFETAVKWREKRIKKGDPYTLEEFKEKLREARTLEDRHDYSHLQASHPSNPHSSLYATTIHNKDYSTERTVFTGHQFAGMAVHGNPPFLGHVETILPRSRPSSPSRSQPDNYVQKEIRRAVQEELKKNQFRK